MDKGIIHNVINIIKSLYTIVITYVTRVMLHREEYDWSDIYPNEVTDGYP